MIDGKCIKCGSSNVRRSGEPKPLKQASGMIPLGGPFGASVPVQWFVCAQCGYAEQYVAREADREKIRKKWKLATEHGD